MNKLKAIETFLFAESEERAAIRRACAGREDEEKARAEEKSLRRQLLLKQQELSGLNTKRERRNMRPRFRD